MKKKVIAAGHICLDITPVFPGRKGKKIDEILLPGKLVQVGSADVHTGGSVANTGLAMKLLGVDVSLMGKIGKDIFGKLVLNILEKFDAQQEMIIDKDESTAYSVILAMPEVDRIFLHNPGANNSFCAGDIPQNKLEETALLHFGYPPLMKAMYEKEGEELKKLLLRAKEAGAATSLDMAAIDRETEAGRVNWEGILEKVIPYVDFFVPSVEELCFMLDPERFVYWQKKAGSRDITECLDLEKDVKPLAEQCMDFGAKIVLIKCGAPGIYYKTADKRRLLNVGRKVELNLDEWADREGFEKSYVPDKVLSGTGAGDTSIAAFLTAMLEGYPLNKAMQLATAAGASCVAAYDAIGGLKSFEELEMKIQNGWRKGEGYVSKSK